MLFSTQFQIEKLNSKYDKGLNEIAVFFAKNL